MGSTLQFATSENIAVENAPTANAFLKLDGALASGVTDTKIGTVKITITDHAEIGGGLGE